VALDIPEARPDDERPGADVEQLLLDLFADLGRIVVDAR
jgi:hypothetical protein